MPSFDIVSKVNSMELENAINQAKKELSTRFDLKDSKSEIVLDKNEIKLSAEDQFKLKALNEIVMAKLAKRQISLKNIDPSYTIRSVPASPHDSGFCLLLGQCAVHAGMSGRTNMVVSFWNYLFTHVPISLAVSERKKIDPESTFWSSVLASTRQPRDMR